MRRIFLTIILLLLAGLLMFFRVPSADAQENETDTFAVKVNYDANLEWLLLSPDSKEHPFSPKRNNVHAHVTFYDYADQKHGTHEVDIEFIRLRIDTPHTSIDIIDEISKREYRPATFLESFFFAEQYPDKFHNWPIAVLGSYGHDADFLSFIPVFSEGNRELLLHPVLELWDPACYIYAVVKE